MLFLLLSLSPPPQIGYHRGCRFSGLQAGLAVRGCARVFSLLPQPSTLIKHALQGLAGDRVVILQRAQRHWRLECEGSGEGIGNLNAA